MHANGLRLITYSRPGHGTSTDMAAVLDRLGVAGCLVAGWSGGGPRAIATAVGLANRARGVLVLAGIAPFDADGLDYFPAWASRTRSRSVLR